MGASARWPTKAAENMASSRNGPASTSAYSSRRLVCATPARLWPATSQPVPSRVIFSRNGSARPALTVTARPSRGCLAAERAARQAPGRPDYAQ